MRDLSDQHGRAALGVTDAQADDEACRNEHSDGSGDRLENDTQEDQRRSHQNRPLSSNAISKKWDKG